MLGLIKVIVVVAVIAVVGGMATHWARDKASSALHRAIDTSLTEKMQAQAWAPVSHGKPVGTARVTFAGGTVTSLHCRTALGTYTADIDHRFTFQRSPAPIKAGCPGRSLRAELARATQVRIDAHGKGERMTFTDAHGHEVAALQARG